MAPVLDETWSVQELVHALCDALVAKGQLKEKPAFIRSDRESKIAGYFESVGLDGAKMCSFDNSGPLEMLVRRCTNGETWVPQVMDALIEMLPESAAKATKKMGMDEDTKAALEEAKEKSAQRRERLDDRDDHDGGKGGGKGGGKRGGDGFRNRDSDFGDREERGGWGDRGDGGREERGGFGGNRDRNSGFGGKGGYRNRDNDFGDREERGGWGDRGDGGRQERGGGGGRECFNCGAIGHLGRDCPEPRKPKGGGKGRGDRDRSAMQCNNCGGYGHKSRDCPEPVDEERVRQRLAAKKEKESRAGRKAGSDDD